MPEIIESTRQFIPLPGADTRVRLSLAHYRLSVSDVLALVAQARRDFGNDTVSPLSCAEVFTSAHGCGIEFYVKAGTPVPDGYVVLD